MGGHQQYHRLVYQNCLSGSWVEDLHKMGKIDDGNEMGGEFSDGKIVPMNCWSTILHCKTKLLQLDSAGYMDLERSKVEWTPLIR